MARVYNFSAGPSMLPEDVLKTASFADELSELCGVPVVMTTADERICGENPDIFPLKLQKKLF